MPLNRLTFLQMFVAPVLQPPEEPTGEMRYRQATDLLIRGLRFERAAELLRLARKQSPNEPRIASALGCALVSRVASLMYASGFTYSLEVDQRNYPKEVAAWEKGKNDPDSEYYEGSRPEPPPQMTFPTKDDSQPFRLRPEELAKKTTAMVAEAQLAFEAARKIAKTPEAEAEVAYMEGWSLRILHTWAGYAGEVGAESGILYSETVLAESEASEEMPETEQETPEKKQEANLYFPKPNATEILKAFTQATEKDPENALYWHALGDILDDPKQIKAAYQKSLERNPRNAGLWYHLYKKEIDQMPRFEGPPGTVSNQPDQPDKERALSYLRMAARHDPSNGYYATEEASLLFKETTYSSYFNSPYTRNAPLSKDAETADYQKTMRADYEKYRQSGATSTSKEAARRAVSLVEKSNQSPHWMLPRYREPVPRWLAAARGYTAWQSAGVDFPQFAVYRELARALSGYGYYLAREDRDNAQAVRACRAGIGLGMRLIGDWPLKDEPGSSAVIRTMVGFAVVSIGMKSLVDVEKLSGNSHRAVLFQTEYDTFRAKVKAYQAARLKVAVEENLYSLY